MDKIYIKPEDKKDAIFLPASQRKQDTAIHGCADELYILYYNNNADYGNGCFEIQILDRETLLKIILIAKNDYKLFFTLLPSYFQNKWKYVEKRNTEFGELYNLYNSADFIVSRDGSLKDEYNFIKYWTFKKS